MDFSPCQRIVENISQVIVGKKQTIELLLVALMAAFPEDTARMMFALERQRTGLELQSAVVDGETWHYLEGGSSDAPVRRPLARTVAQARQGQEHTLDHVRRPQGERPTRLRQ